MNHMNYVAANGMRLAYQMDGPADAPALLLSNSLGTNLQMWEPQLAAFSQVYRVIRYDSRGHGASAAPAGEYTIAQLGRDALALLDALEIERAHVCGLSLGGMVALWLAANAPERVNRVVLADTAARIGTLESWTARIAQVRTGGMRAIGELVVARFLSARYRQRRPEITRQLQAMVEATDPEGYIGACAALRDADLRDLAPIITAPSLIIVGEEDESTPPAQARELHSAIGGSALATLRAAAHLSNVEQPETFSRAVLAFLSRA